MPCCVKQNIPEVCRSVCTGDYGLTTVLQHYSCMDHTLPTLTCIAEGIGKITARSSPGGFCGSAFGHRAEGEVGSAATGSGGREVPHQCDAGEGTQRPAEAGSRNGEHLLPSISRDFFDKSSKD
ncbi:hypothetical protein AVEN_165923-1 [Araneus ventricosus]|uniref:Domain of unknown function DB domain-containing protein n=1 Tax=Araneus ventricosus TaxID=182803 RepID=A0A4Y2E8N0_ARAVE|nr:hypothetical protein AVEN_165923-1 [Araneus ventricosus]